MKHFLSFFFKCAIVCFGAIVLLLIMNDRYKKVMDNPYADTDKFNYMDSTYNNIQICNIGSSHGEYAFYYESLTKELGYECFNFAMASQTYNYDYAILSMYKEHFDPNCIMFIPVSYFSFNNEVTNETEAQSLSTKYYTFLSPKYIPNYDPYVDLVTHHLPILSAAEDIVKLFPKLSLQVFASEAYVPTAEEFQEKASNRYRRHMENKEEYFLPERIENLKDILAFCEAQGITPVLITTPYTDFYSDMVSEDFKQTFTDTITAVSEEYQVPYYNYSEDVRFSEHLEYFADADHLNTEGAVSFMKTIEKEIPEFQEFLSSFKPNHASDPSWKPPY